MPRYHFHLRDHGRIHRDVAGTELRDFEAARLHASAVAEEMMRHSGPRARHLSMFVADGRGELQFDLFFSDVHLEIDPSLDSYSPQMRAMVSETCRRIAALTDVRASIRETMLESRILLARARRRPHLVHTRGE